MKKRNLKFEEEQYNYGRFYPYWLFRDCKLVVMIVASVVIFSIVSLVATLIGKYQFHIGVDHPLFASILLKEYNDESNSSVPPEGADSDTVESMGNNVVVSADASSDAALASSKAALADEGYPTEFIKVEKVKENCPYYDDPGKIALTTGCTYVEVGEEYFDDALFIGDSRIEGLKDYSGLDNAAFYYSKGLTVYDMMTKKIAKVRGQRVTVNEALKEKQYGKIYVMVGINELGIKTTKEYKKQYAKNLDKIEQLQPNADIFIMGVMHMTRDYTNGNEVYNNTNINDKNVAAASLADGLRRFYIDMNPIVTDKDGFVKKKYTWDGIHLKAEYYPLWVDFLKQHGLPDRGNQ